MLLFRILGGGDAGVSRHSRNHGDRLILLRGRTSIAAVAVEVDGWTTVVTFLLQQPELFPTTYNNGRSICKRGWRPGTIEMDGHPH